MHPPKLYSGFGGIFDGVVGGFLGDVDVVGVGLGHARPRDAAELGLRP